MRLEEIPEYQLDDTLQAAICDLFDLAFEGYPNSLTYYNQVPDFRLLAWDGDQLIGQLGVHHRKIAVGEANIFSVFGVADLCVAPDRQLNKVGSRLLEHIISIAEKSNVDFIILTTGEEAFYEKNGFETVLNPCRWLVIHNHESMGVFRRELKRGLLVRECGEQPWPDGEVDFMGHMF